MRFSFPLLACRAVALILSSNLGVASSARAQTLILPQNASGWAYLHPVNEGDGYDPDTVDSDFDTTWFDQSLEGYVGAAAYDGPAFVTGAPAPLAYGGVDGITPATVLTPTPTSGTRGAAYFLKVIDGGATGYSYLQVSMLADDGAHVYLNGVRIASKNMPAGLAGWETLTGNGDESDFSPLAVIGSPVLLPGPNLLAVSVHQTSTGSSDLGFRMEISATPGVPGIAITRGPYLQVGGPDRVTICWRTALPGNSVVRYGSVLDSLDQSVTVAGSRTDHFVTVTGLPPGARRYYRVETNGAGGAQAYTPHGASYFFDTSPPPGSTSAFRVLVLGDSGTANANAAAVYQGFRTINGGPHADVWLMLGDNAYPNGRDTEYQAAVFEMYPETLRNSVLWPALGNHDADLDAILNPLPYLDIFTFPTAGEAGGVGSGTERYYSFDYANVHFICLDSQTAGNYDDVPGDGGMVDWLEADLQATDKDWIIAYYHHGPYTKGSHNSDTETKHIAIRQYVTPLLETYGVDLVLTGHSHNYERSRLIDGHYETSDTFNVSMVKDGGNGSEVGGVDAAGVFQAGAAHASGAYQKPLAQGNAGAVYSTVGASGQVGGWTNGSVDFVNPEPHPAHLVSLGLLGSMVLDIEGGRLRARYIDPAGALRDDFTILKGSTFTMTAADGAFAETGADATAQIRVERTGATRLADTVNFGTAGSATPGVDHTAPAVQAFLADESIRHVTLTALADDRAEGPETAGLQIAPALRSAQPGSAQRRAYFIGAPALATADLADAPAQAWWFQWFGAAALTPANWQLDTDGDDYSERLEYALGGHPLAPEPGPLTSISTEGGVLALHFVRDHRRTDVTIVPETSPDLGAWTSAGVADVLDGPPNPTGPEPRKATVPMDVPRRFLRLNVLGP